MQLGFETLGNASLLFHQDGKPLLATDPWLVGTCYFGSWGLDRKLTEREIRDMCSAEYLWFSHGHPDHLHPDSLPLLSREQKVLLPDHYRPDIAEWLRSEGFAVEILAYRQWKRLTPRVRVMCMDNENLDSTLIIEADDTLVVNLNDSPLCGERRFISNLVKQYDRSKTYLAKLCAYDADMINIVDRNTGELIFGPPDERKPGTVWTAARIADQLGVGSFVCSSSQHVYCRADSVWANPYRVTWADIQKYWSRPHIRILEPYVVIDLATGEYERKHPEQTSDFSQITDGYGPDDPAEQLSAPEWAEVAAFFHKFELLPFDYVEFVVGGERQRIWLKDSSKSKPADKLSGFAFHLPRHSLMESVRSGYFGDLMIGNFMKTELHNATLWPSFTPVVGMLGSNANVHTAAQWRSFRRRYFRRNPVGYIEWHAGETMENAVELARKLADSLGVKGPLKRVYRRMLGDPTTAA